MSQESFINRLRCRAFVHKANRGCYDQLSDKDFILKLHKAYFGKNLDLNNPVTFNEKIECLKLYYSNDLLTPYVDKFQAKKIVESKIGKQYVIPLLGVYDKFSDIDFSALPNSFVLKCTHDSGGLVLCHDKSRLDMAQAKATIEKSLATDYYLRYRERPYKYVPRRIIAEEMIRVPNGKALTDYKFFCFDGTPKFLFVATDRYVTGSHTKFDFFDMDWKHLPIVNGHPNADPWPEKPENFQDMVKIARKLSAGFPFVRIDLYNVDGRIYFGEYTFFHNAGVIHFEPEEWDHTFGTYLHLPTSSH